MSFELSSTGKDIFKASPTLTESSVKEAELFLAELRERPDKSLFQTVAHDRLNKRPQWPAPPDKADSLPVRKVEPCLLSNSQKMTQALNDNWAIYPGATGLLSGVAAGSISKHLALSPSIEAGTRNFKIARAGFIWVLAGFAANYLGGAIASYYSNPDREELCKRNNELSILSTEILKQRQYIQELSGHLQQLLERDKR